MITVQSGAKGENQVEGRVQKTNNHGWELPGVSATAGPQAFTTRATTEIKIKRPTKTE